MPPKPDPSGPDPNFPRLAWNDQFDFPEPAQASAEGIVAVGGNLSPGMLLSAYRQGCFPWYSDDEPILWWNPDPRFVLLPAEFHVGGTLRKVLKKRPFRVTFDIDFVAVMRHCRLRKRPGQNGTWITDAVEEGYGELHRLGFAHSVEVWSGDTEARLVGGLYGIRLGRVFFGESMFSLESNASKVGFATLVPYLVDQLGVGLIDCQAPTAYLASFGARPMPRDVFLTQLKALIEFPGERGIWTGPDQINSATRL
jgi:leucyl/phenylalanyl-tRNA--protein transferase